MSTICPQCGKQLTEGEIKSVHTCKAPEQPPAMKLRIKSTMQFLHSLLVRGVNLQEMPTMEMCEQIEDICKGLIGAYLCEIDNLTAENANLKSEISNLKSSSQARREQLEREIKKAE